MGHGSASTGATRSVRAAVAGLGAALLLLAGCTSPTGETTGSEVLESRSPRAAVAVTDVPAAAATVVAATSGLGARLLNADPDQNLVVSPISVMVAFAMLREGAATTTAAELDRALGFPAEYRGEAMNALLGQLQLHEGDPGEVTVGQVPPEPVLHVADQLFVQEGFEVQQPFLDALATHYGADVLRVDFAARGPASGRAVVDDWVAEHTGGEVDEAPMPFDRTTRLALLNAVRLAAAWQEPFSDATALGQFHRPDGTTTTAAFLEDTRELAYLTTQNGTAAVRIPYTAAFAMDVVLPAPGLRWDPAGWPEAAAGLDAAAPVSVELTLPTWSHTSSLDLSPSLREAGLTETLGAAPDLSGIAPGLWISAAAHQATITVDAAGTVAGAVTGIAATESAEVVEGAPVFRADRPFAYRIVHLPTGLPVFMGQVVDPADAP
ncbi:serpin family protein [Occultella glacieicola]|uniref:Serpin family protein n=1 Tax=Occultella glacieicola TaxID=2518684 RepID=A0ABY2DYM3_9MICO|nr:serpin family protein [Occultella glacieicola]TDE88919.1 serpin family protein [Occultella glacieicola]